MKSVILTLLGLIYLQETLFANDQNAFLNISDQFSCEISSLHPTQMSVGMIEVREKENEITSTNIKHFKTKHPIPTVVGPNSLLYIIDHHHLARAYLESDIESGICVIYANYFDLTPDAFWLEMNQKGWVYPYDQNGHLQPISSLPLQVKDLQDDPYRSLAGAVRDANGYNKNTTPFAEFQWANFFRTRIQIKYFESNLKSSTVKEGIALALSPQAAGLPGYNYP